MIVLSCNKSGLWKALSSPAYINQGKLRLNVSQAAIGGGSYEAGGGSLLGRSYITQITLAQIQDPPEKAIILLDDPTNLTNIGPVCTNSRSTSVDPAKGSVLLRLRLNFADTSDRIVILALGLILS